MIFLQSSPSLRQGDLMLRVMQRAELRLWKQIVKGNFFPRNEVRAPSDTPLWSPHAYRYTTEFLAERNQNKSELAYFLWRKNYSFMFSNFIKIKKILSASPFPPTPLLPSVSLQRGISLSLQAVLRLLPAPPLRAGPSPPLLRLTPQRQKDPRNWRKNSKQRLLRSNWHLHLSRRRREVPKKLHLKRVSFL